MDGLLWIVRLLAWTGESRIPPNISRIDKMAMNLFTYSTELNANSCLIKL